MENSRIRVDQDEAVESWESLGEVALNKAFEPLFDADRRLRTAAGRYLDSYANGSVGVSSSLEARVKSTRNYQAAADKVPSVKHMVDTAEELITQVENRLVSIRILENGSKGKEVESARVDAMQILKELMSLDDRDLFDQTSFRLAQSIRGAANLVSGAATTAGSSAESISLTARREWSRFDEWRRLNPDEDSAVTLAEHSKSLQSFSETADDRNRDFQMTTVSVSGDIGESIASPINEFVAKLRTSKFSTVTAEP